MQKEGNTLDWIISKGNSTVISREQEGEYLTWIQKVEKQQMEEINHTSRNLKSVNYENFTSDLA